MELSLIIPNYNNQKYLHDCLESILDQSYIPDEVIITDDASTDDSVNIIKKYEKEYDFIRAIYNKENKGVAYNRHNAILESKGNYVTTLDSDDFFWDERKLEKEMQLIKKMKREFNKDVIAYSNIVSVDKFGKMNKKIFEQSNIVEGDIFYSVITRKNPIPRDFIMKKEQYLNAGGFNFNLPIYEDWDLKIKLAKKYRFYFTGINGVAYRNHNEGLSAVNYRKHIKLLNKVFLKNKNLLDRKRMFGAYIRFFYFLLKKYINNKIKRYDIIYNFLKKIKND